MCENLRLSKAALINDRSVYNIYILYKSLLNIQQNFTFDKFRVFSSKCKCLQSFFLLVFKEPIPITNETREQCVSCG